MAIRFPAARVYGAVALVATVLVCAPARAEPPFPAAKSDERALRETQLHGVEDTLKASEQQRRQIEADVEAIRLDRARLNAALIETTAKVQETESQRAAATARLAELNINADALSASLDNRRVVISDVLAALQRMGRDPPARGPPPAPRHSGSAGRHGRSGAGGDDARGDDLRSEERGRRVGERPRQTDHLARLHRQSARRSRAERAVARARQDTPDRVDPRAPTIP